MPVSSSTQYGFDVYNEKLEKILHICFSDTATNRMAVALKENLDPQEIEKKCPLF